MCKVFIIAGIKDTTRERAVEFTKLMGELMTPSNDDGLGYAAVDAAGKLSAERWFHNKEAFKTSGPWLPDITLQNKFNKFIKPSDTIKTTYTKHGDVALDKVVAITLHTRAATSGVSMENTHPFISNDTSVIHNGIINNVEDFKFTLSTCDSESILISYLENKVNVDAAGMNAVANSLVGYYACAVFSRDSKGTRILDVFKAHNDNLCVAYIAELETWVMSTSAHDIKTACGKLNMHCGTVFNLIDGVLVRINPVTGDTLFHQEFAVGLRYKSYAPTTYPNYMGAKEYNPEPKVISMSPKSKKNLTHSEIEYFKLPSKIRKLSHTEEFEVLESAGYWR